MPNRAFFKNWDSILLFSVVGTLFNALAIGIVKHFTYPNNNCSGFSLHFLSGFITFAHEFTIFEILQFSSLISAVDPVAVIAVFEVHIFLISDYEIANTRKSTSTISFSSTSLERRCSTMALRW